MSTDESIQQSSTTVTTLTESSSSQQRHQQQFKHLHDTPRAKRFSEKLLMAAKKSPLDRFPLRTPSGSTSSASLSPPLELYQDDEESTDDLSPCYSTPQRDEQHDLQRHLQDLVLSSPLLVDSSICAMSSLSPFDDRNDTGNSSDTSLKRNTHADSVTAKPKRRKLQPSQSQRVRLHPDNVDLSSNGISQQATQPSGTSSEYHRPLEQRVETHIEEATNVRRSARLATRYNQPEKQRVIIGTPTGVKARKRPTSMIGEDDVDDVYSNSQHLRRARRRENRIEEKLDRLIYAHDSLDLSQLIVIPGSAGPKLPPTPVNITIDDSDSDDDCCVIKKECTAKYMDLSSKAASPAPSATGTELIDTDIEEMSDIDQVGTYTRTEATAGSDESVREKCANSDLTSIQQTTVTDSSSIPASIDLLPTTANNDVEVNRDTADPIERNPSRSSNIISCSRDSISPLSSASSHQVSDTRASSTACSIDEPMNEITKLRSISTKPATLAMTMSTSSIITLTDDNLPHSSTELPPVTLAIPPKDVLSLASANTTTAVIATPIEADKDIPAVASTTKMVRQTYGPTMSKEGSQDNATHTTADISDQTSQHQLLSLYSSSISAQDQSDIPEQNRIVDIDDRNQQPISLEINDSHCDLSKPVNVPSISSGSATTIEHGQIEDSDNTTEVPEPERNEVSMIGKVVESVSRYLFS